jgi:putative membrane protein
MEEMIAECTQMMNSMNSMMGEGMMGMMGGGMTPGGMMGSTMAPWWILGWLLVIAVIAAIGLAIVWTVRRPGGVDQPGTTAMTILKRRYAAGEIDADQFEKMKVQISEG